MHPKCQSQKLTFEGAFYMGIGYKYKLLLLTMGILINIIAGILLEKTTHE